MSKCVPVLVRFMAVLCACLMHADESNDHSDMQWLDCNEVVFDSKSPANRTEIKELANIAEKFISSLSSSQYASAAYCLGDQEQFSWTNIPGHRSGGIKIEDLNPEQETLIRKLLETLLSKDAYENIHLISTDIEEASGAGPIGDYTVALFGNPATDPAWGFQFDGHHVGLNFVIDSDNVVLSPAFLGAQPTTLDGNSPLRREAKVGRKLFNELNPDQKQIAEVPDLVRRDVLVGSGRGQLDQGFRFDLDRFVDVGISIGDLSDSQQNSLQDIVLTYVNRLKEPFASEVMDQLRDSLQAGYFVYSQKSDRIYYRIFVPQTILIEYSDVASDHVHTILRLLAEPPFTDYGGYVDHSG